MRSRHSPYVTHVRQHTKPSIFGVGLRVRTAPSLVMPGKGIYTGPECHSATLHTQLYLHFVTYSVPIRPLFIVFYQSTQHHATSHRQQSRTG